MKALIQGDGEAQIGLWGTTASGKTHLLNASADFARKNAVVLQIYDAMQMSSKDLVVAMCWRSITLTR
jgi:chromosomal replication initiation ATPase DnaA